MAYLPPPVSLYDRVPKSSPTPDHQSTTSDFSLSKVSEGRCNIKRRAFGVTVVAWPLVFHCLGSLAIAGAFLYWLNGSHFDIEREHRIPLANGTFISLKTEWYRSPLRVQPDVTTLISVLLRLLALLADAWAASLCWRVVMLLAEKSPDGINRGEIEWITGYGALPPRSHFRRSLNPILGLILLATLVRIMASPILTGSVAWIPSSSEFELKPPPIIPISGVNTSRASFDEINIANIPINLASILNTAWGTEVEAGVFKRVVPAAGPLNVGSKINNVAMPYFSVTDIAWLPVDLSTSLTARFVAMINDNHTFPQLSEQMSQSGAIVLLANSARRDNATHSIYGTWSLLLNVVSSYREHRTNWSCDLSRTILTSDPHLPYRDGFHALGAPGCFALANISFIAGYGVCHECRISSKFTVQTTKLELVGNSFVSAERALAGMPVHVPSLAPLLGSFPDPTKGINSYVSSVLFRSYSALWNAWTDAADDAAYASTMNLYRPLTSRGSATLPSEYQPSFPTLQARIDKTRVYVWLGIQLLFTFAGIAFLFLQAGTCTAHITDTSMLAFDIDSGEAPKPNRKSFKEMLNAFGKSKDAPRKHESEDMFKVVCDSEKNAWKVARIHAPEDCSKLASWN